MREALKKLGFLEQHYANLDSFENAKIKLNKN